MKRLKHGFRGISYHDNLLTPVSNLDTLPQLNLSIHIHHECFKVKQHTFSFNALLRT